MTTITEMARGLAMVLADASKAGLPEPLGVRLDDRTGVDIHIGGGPEELRPWADWAGAEIVPDGAQLIQSAGFLPHGTYADWFETEVARHQDGDCVHTPLAVVSP